MISIEWEVYFIKREEFYLNVYEVVKKIPEGCVTTYGQIAFMLGRPQCSRMVGQALSHAADFEIPCHRVVNCQGRLVCGWKAQGELLVKEGIAFKANGCVDLKKCIWKSIN